MIERRARDGLMARCVKKTKGAKCKLSDLGGGYMGVHYAPFLCI